MHALRTFEWLTGRNEMCATKTKKWSIYLFKFTFSHSNLSLLRRTLSKKTTVKSLIVSTLRCLSFFPVRYKITWMIKMFVKNSAEPTVKNIQTKRFIYSGNLIQIKNVLSWGIWPRGWQHLNININMLSQQIFLIRRNYISRTTSHQEKCQYHWQTDNSHSSPGNIVGIVYIYLLILSQLS